MQLPAKASVMTRTLLFVSILILNSACVDADDFRAVSCEGTYDKHLQGVCIGEDSIFWSFTTDLVKTDMNGKVVKSIPVADHHGDLCSSGGKIYVAVNLGKFNDPAGNADSWVYVYNADDLNLMAKLKLPEVFHGAGGIGARGDRFYVVGGLPDGVQENYVYEYDREFRFVKKHMIKSGHTKMGIQTATFAQGCWWFGCYGSPAILLVTDENFEMQGRFEYDCSLGIVGLPDGRFFSAVGKSDKSKRHSGIVRIAISDVKTGLKLKD
jgi:hypothetical protein